MDDPSPDANDATNHPKKRARVRTCAPFDMDQVPPTETERARLRALDQSSDEWRREREKRLGASSISCAVGLGPATPLDFWRLKTHRIEREDDEDGKRILDRGHKLEPVAAGLYARLHPDWQLESVGIYVHPQLPWLHASPDRLVHLPDGELALLEIKCPVYCLPMRTEIKDQYRCQVQMQLACVPEAQWCDLVFYLHDDVENAPRGIKICRVWRSEAYWQAMIEPITQFARCLMDDRDPTDILMRPSMPPMKTELLIEYEKKKK